MGIAAEAVGPGVEVKDVGFESQQGFVEFRGRILVVVQPGSFRHRDRHRLETMAVTSLRLSSRRSRGCRRASSVLREKWAIPRELSHVEQN